MALAYSLKKLAQLTGSAFWGDPNFEVHYFNTLQEAGNLEVSFLANKRYLQQAKSSKAGILCVDKQFAPCAGKNYLVSDNPAVTFNKIIALFSDYKVPSSGFEGIHPSAIIHESAKLAQDVSIGPNTVICKNVTIGQGTVIEAQCFIGANCSIGEKCSFRPRVTLEYNTQCGDSVILQSGAVIGSDGFGYIPDEKKQYRKLVHLGNVVLEDNVEIGANTTIDRARFAETRVQKGTKIDNLVQIGHNVDIGKNCVIVSQVGVAGSTKIGNYVSIGGQVGIIGHVAISDNVRIAAKAGVSKSLSEGDYFGIPAIKAKKFYRREAIVRGLEDWKKKIEEKLEKLCGAYCD